MQQACSSNSDCTTGTCQTVSTDPSGTGACTYTTSGTGTPTSLPYQECLTTSQLTTMSTDNPNCIATSVSTTGCDDDTDCTTNGNCCIAQTCVDDSGTSTTNYICEPASDQSTSTSTSNGCTYGSCETTNYVPTNFPCSTTSDCATDYSFVGYCCATLSSCSTTTSGSYCVNSADAGLQESGQFGGSDSSCLALCNEPQDAICTAVTFDADSGTNSECAPYDNSTDDITYCCAVQGQDNGDYTTGATGVCMSSADLETPIDNDGVYTVCGAKALISSATFLVALSLF
eukprot:CAMPEP_0170547596 /NCGR_PEP_ID=MMETSP0211-20121228/5990_1 /TAXON_ID=311385 /ORGANISM="Pseudokeronopsis sp., Strain OXSARD2" /LENGTH=286 /DNA_ID=CAMNT_0010852735 /DNA_START=96 /DNA_END=956 /DNA_ORIENTATION=+